MKTFTAQVDDEVYQLLQTHLQAAHAEGSEVNTESRMVELLLAVGAMTMMTDVSDADQMTNFVTSAIRSQALVFGKNMSTDLSKGTTMVIKLQLVGKLTKTDPPAPVPATTTAKPPPPPPPKRQKEPTPPPEAPDQDITVTE